VTSGTVSGTVSGTDSGTVSTFSLRDFEDFFDERERFSFTGEASSALDLLLEDLDERDDLAFSAFSDLRVRGISLLLISLLLNHFLLSCVIKLDFKGE
jgi:hypothetical protein